MGELRPRSHPQAARHDGHDLHHRRHAQDAGLGTYETPNGGRFDVVLRPDYTLAIQYADGTFQNLIPWQPNRFRVKKFPDVVYEFSVVNGRASELKQSVPSGEYKFIRK